MEILLLCGVVVLIIVVARMLGGWESEEYRAGYDGAVLAIRRGADPHVVLSSSQGEGDLNRGARDAASSILLTRGKGSME